MNVKPLELLEMMKSELYDIEVRINCYDEALFDRTPTGLVIKGHVADYFAKLAVMIDDLENTLENDGPYPNYKLITRIHKQYVDHMEGV